MSERPESFGEDGLAPIADAIAHRLLLESQRKNESVARIKKTGVVGQPVPLTEARLTVVSSMIRDFLENPDSVEEAAANLLRFTLTEHSSDEVEQRETLWQLPANEKSGLVESIAGGVSAMFMQDTMVALSDYLRYVANAQELSERSNNLVASYFADNALFEDLVRKTFEPMEFAERRIAPIKKMNPDIFKRMTIESVVASMTAGNHSEGEITRFRDDFENNAMIDVLVGRMVAEHQAVELALFIEEFIRFYGFETLIKIRPQLEEMGVKIDASKIGRADAF